MELTYRYNNKEINEITRFLVYLGDSNIKYNIIKGGVGQGYNYNGETIVFDDTRYSDFKIKFPKLFK